MQLMLDYKNNLQKSISNRVAYSLEMALQALPILLKILSLYLTTKAVLFLVLVKELTFLQFEMEKKTKMETVLSFKKLKI